MNEPCGKVCFDKKTAQTKKNYLEKHNGKRLRIYQCPLCDYAWHLTHTNVRKNKWRKNIEKKAKAYHSRI